jgi:DNA relaxase NicK
MREESGVPLESLINKHQIHRGSLDYIGKIIPEVEEQKFKWIISKLCLTLVHAGTEAHIAQTKSGVN